MQQLKTHDLWQQLPSHHLLCLSPLLNQLKTHCSQLYIRPQHLQQIEILGKHYDVQRPITFTPYASSKVCSARCWFCSENLRFEAFDVSSTLRIPAQYHQGLAFALDQLYTLPMGLSLSGLEFSDDVSWTLNTIDVLDAWQHRGGIWQNKACYSNLAGFADLLAQQRLIHALSMIGIDRFEVSRHHFDENINQNIMRFRPKQSIQSLGVFSRTLSTLVHHFPMTLVCIIQKQGIETLDDIQQYIAWAKDLGIKRIIFRELSDLDDDRYQQNRTARDIKQRRINLELHIAQLLAKPPPAWALMQVESGYYYWNCVWRLHDIDIIFERSDYAHMQHAHDSEIIHKLVFHANGHLCADWTPDRHILIQAYDHL